MTEQDAERLVEVAKDRWVKAGRVMVKAGRAATYALDTEKATSMAYEDAGRDLMAAEGVLSSLRNQKEVTND